MPKYMLLYGKKSIHECLKANPARIKKIFMEESLHLPEIKSLINKNNIEIERLKSKDLENMKRARNLQGIIAKIELFKYASYEELLAKPELEKLNIVFLDRITDPQNLGIILRSLACFGNFAIVIPEKEACGITDAVLHVAYGGENYVAIAMVDNLSTAILESQKAGYWVMGAMVESGESLSQITIKTPVGLVLGAETEGISEEIANILDSKVFIPMPGRGLSLNVSMACTVFAHEITKSILI